MFNWAILSILLFTIINVQIEAESHIYLVEMAEKGNGKNNDYYEPVSYPPFTGESAHPAGCPMDQELMRDCQCGHFTCYTGEKCAIYKKDKFSMLIGEPNKNEQNCKISGNSPRLGNLNDFWVTMEDTTPTSGPSNKEMLCIDGKLSCECPTSLEDKKPKRCHTWNGYRNEVLCKCTKEQAPTTTEATDTTPIYAPSATPSSAAAPAITPILESLPVPSPAAAPATIPTPEPSNTPSPASAPATATTPASSNKGCPMDQELMEDCQCGHFTCYTGEKCAIYNKDEFRMLGGEPNKNEPNCKISGNSPRSGKYNNLWVTMEATTPTSGPSNKGIEMLCKDGKLSCKCPTSLKDKKPKRCHKWGGYISEVLCKCTKEQVPTTTAATDTTPTHAPSPPAAPAITPIPEPSPIPSPAAAPATIPIPEPSNTSSPASAPATATTPAESNEGNDSSGVDDSGSAPGSGEGNCGASSISGSSFSPGGSGCPMYQKNTEDCQCGSETCYAGETCEKFNKQKNIIYGGQFSRNCTTNDTTRCIPRCRRYGTFCCDGYPIFCTCPDGTRDTENMDMCTSNFGSIDSCTCSDGKVIYRDSEGNGFSNNDMIWSGPARDEKPYLED